MAQVDPLGKDIIPATEGFHDLKPVPEFFPAILFSWYTIAAICLALLVAGLMWMRRAGKTSAFVPLTAKERTLRELESLSEQRARGNITARDYASAVSFTLRGFLESLLLIPATERTSLELISILPTALERMLGMLGADRRSGFVTALRAVLRDCDMVAFAAGTEALAAEGVANELFARIAAGSSAAVNDLDRMFDEMRALQAARKDEHSRSPHAGSSPP